MSVYALKPSMAGPSITEYYEKGAKGYRASTDAVGDSRIANVVDCIISTTKPGARILDVGCGDMALARLLPQYEWTGIDLDDSKNPKITKQDLTQTPYKWPERHFDTVVCSEVLEHLFDPTTVILELNRLCKGSLVVTVPNLNNLDILLTGPKYLQFDAGNQTSVEHIRWYSPYSIIKLLEANGFVVEQITGNSPHLSQTLAPGRAWLQQKYPDKSAVELDQLIGGILPGYCPGLTLLCRVK